MDSCRVPVWRWGLLEGKAIFLFKRTVTCQNARNDCRVGMVRVGRDHLLRLGTDQVQYWRIASDSLFVSPALVAATGCLADHAFIA